MSEQLAEAERRIEEADPSNPQHRAALIRAYAEIRALIPELRKRNPLEFFQYKQPKQLDFRKSQKGTRVIYGGNRCTVAGTRVLTARGLVPCEEVVVGDRVLYSGQGRRIGYSEVVSTWASPEPVPVFKLTTKRGYTITANAEHPLWVCGAKAGGWHNGTVLDNDWRFQPLSEIKVGQFVRLGNRSDSAWGTASTLTEDDAYFLGLMTGDGWWHHPYGRMSFSSHTDDAELFSWVTAYLLRHDVEAKVEQRSENGSTLYWCNLGFKRRVLSWGVTLATGEGKAIPECVWRAPKPIARAFLSGLFDTDGCGTTKPSAVLVGTNLKLIRDVHAMLLRFGIVSSCHDIEPQSNFNRPSASARLEVCGRNARSFRDQIGFRLKRKQDRLPAGEYAEPYMHDRIASIEPVGEARVYGFTCPPHHAYWANGILSHNSGKSEVAIVEACAFSTGQHPFRKVPKNTHGCVISLTHDVQRDALQPKFVKWMPKHRWFHTDHKVRGIWDRLILTCGNCFLPPKSRKGGDGDYDDWLCPRCEQRVPMISFKTVEQGRQTFQAVAWHWAAFDEEPPEDIDNEVRMRLVDYQGVRWYAFTPLLGQTWTYDRLYIPGTRGTDPDIGVFEFSTLENAALPREERDKLDREMLDPAERAMRLFGHYAILSGLVYKEWDPALHEIDKLPDHFLDADGRIRPSLDVYCGIDTGKFFAASFWLVDHLGNLYGFDELFTNDHSTRDNATDIKAICRRWGIDGRVTFYLDPRSQQLRDLQDNGINALKMDAIENEEGIAIVKGYLTARVAKDPLTRGDPWLKVVAPNMPRFLWERARYQYQPPLKSGPNAGAKRSEPVKRDNHMMDCSKYVIQTKPEPSQFTDDETGDPVIRGNMAEVRRRMREREESQSEEGYGDDAA